MRERSEKIPITQYCDWIVFISKVEFLNFDIKCRFCFDLKKCFYGLIFDNRKAMNILTFYEFDILDNGVFLDFINIIRKYVEQCPVHCRYSINRYQSIE